MSKEKVEGRPFKAGDIIRINKDCPVFTEGARYVLQHNGGLLGIQTQSGGCISPFHWKLVTLEEELEEQCKHCKGTGMNDISGYCRFCYPKQKNTEDQICKSNMQIYANIMSWCYIMDGKFPDKNEWRKAFSENLKKELLIS